jgi:hypothetical protein
VKRAPLSPAEVDSGVWARVWYSPTLARLCGTTLWEQRDGTLIVATHAATDPDPTRDPYPGVDDKVYRGYARFVRRRTHGSLLTFFLGPDLQ